MAKESKGVIRERRPKSPEDKIGHLRFDRAQISERSRYEAHMREQKIWREIRGDVAGDPNEVGSNIPPEKTGNQDEKA